MAFQASDLITPGVAGLATVVSGLFGLKGQAKQRKLSALQEGLKSQQESQQAGAQQLASGTQSALAQLMAQYGGLIR